MRRLGGLHGKLDRPRKVYIFTPVAIDSVGGIASHIRNQISMLNNIGIEHEIIIVEPQPSNKITYIFWFGLQKVLNKLLAPLGFYVRDFFVYLRLRRLLLLLRSNIPKNSIFHCHALYSSQIRSIISSWNRNIPIVLTVHGYIADEAVSRKTVKRHSGGYKYLLEKERKLYSSADQIICVDSRLAEHVAKILGNKRKVHVIFNSVDTDIYKYVEKLNVEKNSITILCPRILNPKNGVIIAVKALEELVKQKIFNTIKLIIAGDGIERKNIEYYIKSHGLEQYVEMKGNVPHKDIINMIETSDVVVIPSIPSENVEEATSLALLEGMACGKVVVASAIGGLKEVISNYEDGVLVPPGDPYALAEGIIFAYNHREEIGRKARCKIEKEFSLYSASEKLLKVYLLSIFGDKAHEE